MADQNNDGIVEISRLENFGIFKDFIWDKQTTCFGKRNLIYGWNYSGKTTFSRLFQALDDVDKVDEAFRNANFKIKYNESEKIKECSMHKGGISEFPFPIKVFNQDYIERVFVWKKLPIPTSIDPISFHLGDAADKIESDIEELKAELENFNKEKAENDIAVKDFLAYEKGGKFTALATEIRAKRFEGFSQPNQLNASNVTRIAERIKEDLESNDLKDKEEGELEKANARGQYKKQNIGFELLQELDCLKKEVKGVLKIIPESDDLDSMLKQKIEFDDLDDLKENAVLSDWVQKGVELHADIIDNKCKFCRNDVPKDRLKILNSFYSEELTKIQKLIQSVRDKIETEKSRIDITFLHKNDIAGQYHSEYEEAIKNYKFKSDEYRKQIKLLESDLSRKEQDIFIELEASEIEEISLSKEIGNISFLINKHNEYVDSQDKQKQEAIEKLVNHYVAIYLRRENYLEKSGKHDIATTKNMAIEANIGRCKAKIKNLERDIKGTAEAQEILNRNIKILLNENATRIDLDKEGRFFLMRNDVPATNLSEGEKAAIAFSYFMTEVESLKKTGDLSKAIIFIDDPISSLDSNHVFQACSLINNFFESNDFSQLFISTHSFEFLSMVKQSRLFTRSKGSRGKKGFYFIERRQDIGSIIRNMPSLFLDYRSEYVVLFSLLQEHNESEDKSDISSLATLPNILRRVVELYTLMKYPSAKNFSERLEQIIIETQDDMNGAHHLKGIMNWFSHLNDIQKITYHDDKIFNISQLIKDFLKFVESKDELHWRGLQEGIKGENWDKSEAPES